MEGSTKRMAVPERLYTPKQAPTVVGLKTKTLDEYRRLGVGPEFIRAGSRIFYKESSLLAYLDSCPRSVARRRANRAICTQTATCTVPQGG
jgi:hypothetical protein